MTGMSIAEPSSPTPSHPTLADRLLWLLSPVKFLLPEPAPKLAAVTVPRGMEQSRMDWIDVAKGMSILLVVYLHAHLFLKESGLSNTVYGTISWAFNPVRMPLFFAMSGLLAVSALQTDWRTLSARKLWYFLYLFTLWHCLHVVLFKYALWHPFADFSDPLIWEMALGLVRPSTSIWFIWALIFYFAFARALRHAPVLAAALSVAAGLLGETDLLAEAGASYAQQNLFKFLPFFVLPALFGQAVIGWVSVRPLQFIVAGVALAGGLKLVPDLLASRLDEGFLGLVRQTGGLAIGAGAAIAVARFKPAWKTFAFFGRHTLPIYLIHSLPLSVMTMLVQRYEVPGFALYGVPLIAIVSIALSLAIDRLAERMGKNHLSLPRLKNRPIVSA